MIATKVRIGDQFESQDRRDTDPQQPGGLRRVKVTRIEGELAQVQNLTSGRRTVIMVSALGGSKWKRL